jgi:hypothetical protein
MKKAALIFVLAVFPLVMGCTEGSDEPTGIVKTFSGSSSGYAYDIVLEYREGGFLMYKITVSNENGVDFGSNAQPFFDFVDRNEYSVVELAPGAKVTGGEVEKEDTKITYRSKMPFIKGHFENIREVKMRIVH